MSNFQKNLKFKKKKKKSKSSKSDEGGDENQKINFTRPKQAKNKHIFTKNFDRPTPFSHLNQT